MFKRKVVPVLNEASLHDDMKEWWWSSTRS